MLTDNQKQELDKIRKNYIPYVDSYTSGEYKVAQSIEKECLKIFYTLVIQWAEENGVIAFCTAWYFSLPVAYRKHQFYVQKVALWNNKRSIQGKTSSWINKVSVNWESSQYNGQIVYKYRICKHKVTTDAAMLEPFASNFCAFIQEVVVYLNQDNDFSKYQPTQR